MDVFSIGLQLAFAAVFVVVLQRYLRDRRPVHRDLLFVAGSVVGWFALSTLNTLVPAIGTSVVRLSAIFIFIQPVLTLRLVRHFVPVRRNLVLAALACSVGALVVAFAIGTRGNPIATALVVGCFVFFESVGAVLLAQAARNRVGYASTRLWIAAIGTLLFAATILVRGHCQRARPSRRDDQRFADRGLAAARPLGGAVLPRGVHAAAAPAAASAARHGVRLRTIAHRVAGP